jgi:hypothetical protein
MKQDVLYIVVMILVPLAPAYLIYRNLPSRTEVQGPFQGLQLKLTGAFGGYFLLVLCIFGFITMRQRTFTIYTVEGKIQMKPGQAAEDISMYLAPPVLQVLDSGDFTMKIAIENDRPEVPRLVIDSLGHYTMCIDLTEDQAGPVRWDGNKIKLQTPVILQAAEATPYQSDGAMSAALQNEERKP